MPKLYAYFLPEKDRQSKISPRAVPAVHLGYDSARNSYRVFVPSLNRITTAHHISFSETKFMIFTDDGIASMPDKITPLKGTEFQYREERDEPEIHKRSKRKPTDKDIPAPIVPPHSFMPATSHDNDATPDHSVDHDDASDGADDQPVDHPDTSEHDSSLNPSDGNRGELPTRAEQKDKRKESSSLNSSIQSYICTCIH